MKSKTINIKKIVLLCILSLMLIASISIYAISTNKSKKITNAATIVSYNQ